MIYRYLWREWQLPKISFVSKTPLFAGRKLHSSPHILATTLEEVKTQRRSIEPLQRRPKLKMPPYVKNLFRGKIDPDVFAYPELDEGSLNVVEDMKTEMEKFLNTEDLWSDKQAGKISREVISKLKDLGIFKANIPHQFGGLELTKSEILRIAEVFGKDPSLYLTLETHLHYISELVTKFGNEKQKEQYLPALASGDLQMAFALWEEKAGVDVSKLDCMATFHGDCYILTGKKRWVCNGGIADKYVVFATETKASQKGTPDVISCFLVDKSSEGISAKSMETLGVDGYNTWEVTFDGTRVAKDDMIGEPGQGITIIKALLHGKFTLAGARIGLLRDLLNLTVHHAINRNTFGKPLIEWEIVQMHLAQAATRIYALESITYMTADFYDNIEDPDIELETAIVKLYSSETLSFVVQKCLTILGSDSYLKDRPYEKILRDSLFSNLVETSPDCLRMTIALLGLNHVGGDLQDYVTIRRNPLYYPEQALKYFAKHGLLAFDNEGYTGVVYEHCHPSLSLSAEFLEKSILKFGKMTEDALVKWGKEISDKQINLARLADVAINLYISTAVLARASRAISIGLRNCDVDGNMAQAIVTEAFENIQVAEKQLNESPCGNNDANFTTIAKTMIHERKYHAIHPLARNY